LQDILELRAGGDGGVGGRYGLDKTVGPGGVCGEVEELAVLLGMRKRGLKTWIRGTYYFPDLFWGAIDFDFSVNCHFLGL